jgi:hypothetical protein
VSARSIYAPYAKERFETARQHSILHPEPIVGKTKLPVHHLDLRNVAEHSSKLTISTVKPAHRKLQKNDDGPCLAGGV